VFGKSLHFGSPSIRTNTAAVSEKIRFGGVFST